MLIKDYFKNIDPKYKNHYFSGFTFNSKDCKKNYIFFAIKGINQDGNNFIKNAIKKGARTIVHERKILDKKKNILYLRSQNIRKTLSNLSYKIYKKKPNNLIAVTGTNGKSSIANFFFQFLYLNKIKSASIGTLGINLNNKYSKVNNTTLDPIDLAKQLNKIKKRKIENVILEASSHGLKQHRLDGLEFKKGIFTNLSHDHLDYHKNLNDYLKSKLYLFEKLLKKKSVIITDKSIKQFAKIENISKRKKLKIKTILTKNSDLALISHKFQNHDQLITVKYKNKLHNFKLKLVGKIQIKNILMAALAAESKNLKFEKIINSMSQIKPVSGRLEIIGKLKNNSIVILDYAHTPEALETCLSNVSEQFNDRKIHIVFGCGGNRDEFKRPKMGDIANRYCDKIYLTDDNPRFENPKKIRNQIKTKIKKSKILEISDRAKAIFLAIQNLRSKEVLIIAGKGHEQQQDYGKFKKFFSDKSVISDGIRYKNKKLKKNLKFNILNDEISKTKNIKISNASINSKTIKKNEIFFAIKGKKKDGNYFIKDAFNRGASYAVVNKVDNSVNKNRQLKVKNPLDTLTNLSKKIRQNYDGKIIAITGSCGKTSLKKLMGDTINNFSTSYFSPKSYNNKYGVPLSLFNLNLKNKVGIFEIGMDKKGEIDYLSKIINPNIGVITNISYAHIKNFKNLNQIAEAKSEIINNIKKGGSIVLNHDDKFFNFHKKKALNRNLKVVSFSLKKNGDIFLEKIKKEKNKFSITVKIFKNKRLFYVKSIFKSFISNILASLGVLSILGNINQLNKYSFLKNDMPAGRGDISKIKYKNKKISLIDESYNSNPLSLKSAIENFSILNTKNNKKHVILGDMLELGSKSKNLHIQSAKFINSSSIDKVHIYGEKIKYTYKNIIKKKQGSVINNKKQIFNLLVNELNNNDYLMIKGSNSTGLNKFTNELKMKKFN